VQPIAFGATLDLNPLAVLIVTIGGGALFGMVGLVLGAPLTSAAVHISRELAAAKAADAAAEPPGTGPEPMPTVPRAEIERASTRVRPPGTVPRRRLQPRTRRR